jgi:hypothetical protein
MPRDGARDPIRDGTRNALAATLLCALVAGTAVAADWTPAAWVDDDTLELRTTGADEGEHWFPVWLVVLDDQVYVRLGSRAAKRIEANTTTPWVGVRVAGQQFDRVKAEPAPDRVEPVAKAMAGKYWSDVVIRLFPHPLTLRLVPE